MADANLIAIDLPGHGLSDHLNSAIYNPLEYAANVLELAESQGWEQFHLIGHSLGGTLASLIAGIHPEKIARLVLIDAIGPLPASAEQTRGDVARYLSTYLKGKEHPVYRTRFQAVKARIQLADILAETAETLIERDLKEVPGGYSWRHDVRLKYPTVLALSEEEILEFLRNIKAPTLLVKAARTALREEFYPRRIDSVPDLTQVTFAGGHHLHMENADPVAAAIREFLDLD